ncbi:MAG: CRISPR-associated endonuclease Cas2 [Bacteroidota bacterium]
MMIIPLLHIKPKLIFSYRLFFYLKLLFVGYRTTTCYKYHSECKYTNFNPNCQVIYDFKSNSRRAKFVKTLEKYGVRVQYSVFEFFLTKARKIEIMAKLKRGEFFENKKTKTLKEKILKWLK